MTTIATDLAASSAMSAHNAHGAHALKWTVLLSDRIAPWEGHHMATIKTENWRQRKDATHDD